MYVLSITKVKYPENDTQWYEYSSLDNLLKELKEMIENKKIGRHDIIRIEEEL